MSTHLFFRISLLPFCTITLLTTLLYGCSTNPSLTNSLIPFSEKMRFADDFVSDAVSQYNKGDQEQGDTALQRAVILLTSPINDDFSDEGYIEVAKRIGAKGRPQDAVRLLEPLVTDKRVNQDPLLWATLAESAKHSGNTPRFEEANKRAEKEAGAIVATFGGPVPQETEAIKKAILASRAGQYFDEYTADYPKAFLAYREAHRLLPNDLTIASKLGYLLANRGTTPDDFNEAVQITRSVVDQQPEHPLFLDAFGWALYKRNNAQEQDRNGARRRLREAVDIDPDIPETHFHLAIVYEKMELFSDALREAERAKVLQPDSKEIQSLCERLTAAVAAMPPPTPSPESSPYPSPSEK